MLVADYTFLDFRGVIRQEEFDVLKANALA